MRLRLRKTLFVAGVVVVGAITALVLSQTIIPVLNIVSLHLSFPTLWLAYGLIGFSLVVLLVGVGYSLRFRELATELTIPSAAPDTVEVAVKTVQELIDAQVAYEAVHPDVGECQKHLVQHLAALESATVVEKEADWKPPEDGDPAVYIFQEFCILCGPSDTKCVTIELGRQDLLRLQQHVRVVTESRGIRDFLQVRTEHQDREAWVQEVAKTAEEHTASVESSFAEARASTLRVTSLLEMQSTSPDKVNALLARVNAVIAEGAGGPSGKRSADEVLREVFGTVGENRENIAP